MEKGDLNFIKVSVCVSFYNAAPYVQRCLDMLCSQTMKDGLEIVLVNDGSNDNTDELMRNYATCHPERKFVLVTQVNKSLCQGRMTGVANSSGEYVTFLDQDDLIDATAYEKLYQCAKQHDVDIVEFRSKHGDEVLSSPFIGLQNSHSVLKHYFTKGGIQSQLWMRLYKRSLFNKPILPQIRTNNEDMYGWPCLLHAANTIYFYPEILHTYSIDDNSFMGSLADPSKAERRFQSRKIALGMFNHFRSFVGIEGIKEYYMEFNQFMAEYLLGFLITKFYGKSMDVKVASLLQETGISSRKELMGFLDNWLPQKSLTYGVYRLFGLNAAYVFHNLRLCFIK